MIENKLSEALRDVIAEAVKDYVLPTKTGAGRAPNIVNGYLPPKRSTLADDFPFVLVRPDQGASERGQTEVTVSIIIGCYSEEFDGYEYCLNVMTRIRNALAMMESQTLDRKYQLQWPITWENPTDQPYPQWQIDMTTKWIFNTPQLPGNFEEGY